MLLELLLFYFEGDASKRDREVKISQEGKTIMQKVLRRLWIELKILWNGVNPCHGRKTVVIDTKTGNIIKKY